MMSDIRTTLAISGKHHAQLKRHLFPGDGKEAVAIALCGKNTSKRRHLITVREIIEVPYAKCRVRKPDRVTWAVETILPALEKAMSRGLTVVKFHSHPGGYEDFSDYDDESDKELFASVDGYLDTDLPQASVVMLPNGRLFGRRIVRGSIGNAIDDFRVAGDDFHFWRPTEGTSDGEVHPDHATRILQAFGEGTFATLRSLRIGVVGCSGTGSVVIEQLARNCVGGLVLVEPGVAGDKNLNRILNSTKADAKNKRPKIEISSRSIRRIGLGTEVIKHQKGIFTKEVIADLADCDILFGCVDSIDGRHILNKIATYFLIPFIDMGVRLDADGKGGIEQMCGAVHTLQPGGSSLLSRGVYTGPDLEAAFMKVHEPERYAEMHKAGYVRGTRVDKPAVISLNMLTASIAVNEMLARLHPFRNEENSAYAQRRIVLTDPAASFDEGDGQPCRAFAKWVGFGDQQPMLGYPELA